VDRPQIFCETAAGSAHSIVAFWAVASVFFLTEIRQDLWAVVIGRFMELKNGFFFFNRFSLFLPFLGNA
jgi:hypothetical protein